MTLHERMMSVYQNKLPDKHALGIYTRYLKRGNMERNVRNEGMGIIDYVALTTQIGPPWHLIPEFISEVRETDINIQFYFEHGVRKERRSYKTPIGEVYAEVETSLGDGSEHISKYYITSLEDYKIIKYIVDNTVIKSNEKHFLHRCETIGDDGVVLGRLDRNPYQKIMIELAGAEQFLMDLYTDPDPVLELMSSMQKRADEQIERVLESKADILWMPDNVTADMTPPNAFEKYLLPGYQKNTRLAHQAGKTVVVHFDGKIKALSALINESGIDVLESVSDPLISGDLDYEDACISFPNKVILPNFPANLALKTKEVIQEYVRVLRTKAAGKPFMLQVSEDLDEKAYCTVLPILAEAMNAI